MTFVLTLSVLYFIKKHRVKTGNRKMANRKVRGVAIGRLDAILSGIFIILSAVGMRLADVIGPQIAQFLNSSIRHAASGKELFNLYNMYHIYISVFFRSSLFSYYFFCRQGDEFTCIDLVGCGLSQGNQIIPTLYIKIVKTKFPQERILYLAPWLGLNLSYLILASTVTLIQWTKLVDSSVPLLKAFGIILVSIAILCKYIIMNHILKTP